MTEVDRLKRYDCFVSFYGDEDLSALGLPSRSRSRKVQDFVEGYVIPHLQKFESRSASVFPDSADAEASKSAVFDAIMQLRGGGLALVLLTSAYLDDDFCLAQLRSLLSYASLRDVPGRHMEAIKLRFVCLDVRSAGEETGVDMVKDKLRDMYHSGIWRSFVSGLLDTYNIISFRSDRSASHSSLEVDASNLCEGILRNWKEKSKTNLGGCEKDSFTYMQKSFVHKDVGRLARDLKVLIEKDYMVEDVLTCALRDETISYRNVDRLLEVCTDLGLAEACNAVRSYHRKWCSTTWPWSTDVRNEMKAYVQEAEKLRDKERSSSALNNYSFSSAQVTDLNDGAPSGSRQQIFLCYCTPDKPLARRLVIKLRSLKLSVYAAESTKWDNAKSDVRLMQVWNSAGIGLFIVSPDFARCQSAVDAAKRFQKRSRECEARAQLGPTSIPVIFRMSCNNFQKLQFDISDEAGNARSDVVFAKAHALFELGQREGHEVAASISNKPRLGESEEQWEERLDLYVDGIVAAVQRVAQRRTGQGGQSYVTVRSFASALADAASGCRKLVYRR